MYDADVDLDYLVKYSAQRDDPNCTLPPELELNNTMPAQNIDYSHQAEYYMYAGDSNDEDLDLVEIDQDGRSLADQNEKAQIERILSTRRIKDSNEE